MKTRKILSLALALVMVLTLVPMATPPAAAVGQYGVNLDNAAYRNKYARPQCTWYCWGRAMEKCGVDLTFGGNAGDWYNNAKNAGFSVGPTARENSICVFRDVGSSLAGYGHVAFIEKISGTTAYYTEGNYLGQDYHEYSFDINSGGVYIGNAQWEQRVVGYIYLNSATSSEPSPSGPSTLSIKSPNAPSGTLKQGSYFGLTGTFSSNYNITSIYGRIVDNNTGSTVDSYTQRNVGKLYTLAYNTMDNNLEFNLLSPGAYYLSYEIKDESGKTASWKSGVFYVKGSTPCKTHTKGTYKFPEAKHPHYQYWECAVCGNNFTDGSTKKLDSCTVCNPPKPNCDKGHTWGGWKTVKAATCTKNGSMERKCSVCGKTEAQSSPALGHDYRVSQEADTYIRYTCFYCNDSYTTDKKANCDKGHTWSEWEEIESPTCLTNGKAKRVCTLCGKTEQLPILAYKHQWSDWSTVEQPSCELEGRQERVCKIPSCDEKETRTLPALSHDYRVKQETDTSILYVCRNCGDSYSEVKKSNCSAGHTWGGWETVKKADCENDGKRQRTCSVCGEREEEPLPATGHDWRLDSDGYYRCTQCDATDYTRRPTTHAAGMENFQRAQDFYSWLFDDVNSNAWYYNNVRTAYELGLMKGTGSGTFSPGNNVTLAEAITLAARIHSIYHTGTDSFDSYDGGNWYDPYVDYAGENGIVNTYYNYTRPATREEFVHILAKALPDHELTNTVGSVSFADSGSITYLSDVRLLSEAGVINGIQENGKTYFKPEDAITRAEVAAVIGRMVMPNTRVSASIVSSSTDTSELLLTGNGSFAVSLVDLDAGDFIPMEETNLGDLIADSLLWWGRKNVAQIVPSENIVAIMDNLHIKPEASLTAGALSEADVDKIINDCWKVSVAYVSGEALLETLESATRDKYTFHFPQVAGINFSINTAATYDAGEYYPDSIEARPKSINRVTINNINGNRFDPLATYAVIKSRGTTGGRYSALGNNSFIGADTPLIDILKNFITEELDGVIGNEYAKPQGRIIIK